MIKYIAFDNQINIFWDKDFNDGIPSKYEISVNGIVAIKTDKTHYEIKELEPNTEYAITVKVFDGEGKSHKKQLEARITTQAVKRLIDITKSPYKAVGDANKLNTQAIQKALDACQKGDVIYFPKGTYLTGALDVHSDTEIYLSPEATLQGSYDFNDYAPKMPFRFEGLTMEKYRGLLNVGKMDESGKINCENVVIRGGGRINGGGISLCESTIADETVKLEAYMKSLGESIRDYECARTIPGRARPCLFEIYNCKNFVLDEVSVGYGACWNVHFTYCEDVVISNCKIKSKGVWNGDGIDPDSSVNTHIYGCKFGTHDDAIAIKSGKNPEGNIVNKPCKDVRIFDCFGSTGIAIGSEISGGIENVFVWDCNFYSDPYGFRIKTSKFRGGYVKNVQVQDCEFASICVDTQYDCNNDGDPAKQLTKIENVAFSNVVLTGLHGDALPPPPVIKLYGFDREENAVKNVLLDGIHIKGQKRREVPIVVENVKGLTVKNIFIQNGQ